VDDRTVLQHIEQLVAREREIEESHLGRSPSDAQRKELKEVEVELDQCWDLLRQRRARRDAGQDPDVAAIRSKAIVENYLQ
jgi:hypothetical protein